MKSALVGMLMVTAVAAATAQSPEKPDGVTLAFAPDDIQITAPVMDPKGYLAEADVATIEASLRELRAETGVQMTVLLIDSTGAADIGDFAQGVFDRWGGGSAERNDGILFVLAIDDRRSRLHLGSGLESVIGDDDAREMLDALRSPLRARDYAGATRQIIGAVAAAINAPLGSKVLVHLPIVLALGIFAGVLLGLGRRRKVSFIGTGRGTTISVVGSAALVALIYHADIRYGLSYAALWLIALFAGTSCLRASRNMAPVKFVLIYALTVVLLSPLLAIGVGPSISLDGNPVITWCLSIGFLLALATLVVSAGLSSSGRSSSGRSSSWSSGSSSSSSSSSSYGSGSSSSSSSSSSGSSSGWSGGGGSSSGGGASSSW